MLGDLGIYIWNLIGIYLINRMLLGCVLLANGDRECDNANARKLKRGGWLRICGQGVGLSGLRWEDATLRMRTFHAQPENKGFAREIYGIRVKRRVRRVT